VCLLRSDTFNTEPSNRTTSFTVTFSSLALFLLRTKHTHTLRKWKRRNGRRESKGGKTELTYLRHQRRTSTTTLTPRYSGTPCINSLMEIYGSYSGRTLQPSILRPGTKSTEPSFTPYELSYDAGAFTSNKIVNNLQSRSP